MGPLLGRRPADRRLRLTDWYLSDWEGGFSVAPDCYVTCKSLVVFSDVIKAGTLQDASAQVGLGYSRQWCSA